jgi:hypothetical protein
MLFMKSFAATLNIDVVIIVIIRYNYNNAGDKRYAGAAGDRATVDRK